MEITKEQREKMVKLKVKRPIKLAENRRYVDSLNLQSRLSMVEYYIASLMQGQMYQNNILQTAINNLSVETNKVKKKADKLKH